MSELLGVAVPEWGRDLGEELKSLLGNTHQNRPSVPWLTRPGDEPADLEFVEHPCDVRGPGDEAVGEGEGRDWGHVIRAEQPKQIVLLRGQVKAAKQLIFQGPEPVVGSPQIQERFLLRRIEPSQGVPFAGLHTDIIIRWTIVVQTIIGPQLVFWTGQDGMI
jgi:hypothetical protein